MPNYIAFDLELEQPNRGKEITDSLAEQQTIIQVGWVVFSPDDEPNDYIKRSYCINIGFKLSTFIKNLTGIKDEDIQNGTTLEDVYRNLVQDCEDYNCTRVLRQWGSGDQEEFRNELQLQEKWQFGRSGCNVKHHFQSYAQANNMPWSGGLSKCCNRIGLDWVGGRKHDALVDSINTARLYSFIFFKLID